METRAESQPFWYMKGADPYVDSMFLMASPITPILVVGSYLYFVLKCGPAFMKNRPAFQLNNTMLIYNAFQVAYSCYMFYLGVGIISTYGLVENGFCALDSEKTKLEFFNGGHLYLMAKFSELLDTVFFVLRKKSNQVTFLHVYHHCITLSLSWIVLKIEPTYSLTFIGVINCLVHIVMYSYYGLSAFPGLHKFLWWKKYITKMQLTQFVLMLIHVVWNHFVTTCPPSYLLMSLTWSQAVIFFVLFSDFYFKSYKQKGQPEAKTAEEMKKKRDSLTNYFNNNNTRVKNKNIGSN